MFVYLSILAFVRYTHAFALPFEGLYKLDIIHYNDFHARFEETSVDTPTCRYNNNSCLGGFPRLYYEIHTLLQEKPDSIVLNAGDSFQGTYWYTLLKWNVTQEFMNLIPHDAHAIGNHEFDDGPSGLAPYLAALKAPVLAANMDTSKELSLEGLYRPHIVITRKGRKIGIIGLATPETKILSSSGNVIFTDPVAAAKREAKALYEKGVDIIVLLSHCGLEVDKKIAREAGENIDIIVGGHSHSLLWNGRAPSGEEVSGPYPVFIETTKDKKHQVLIVQASAFTKYMGNLSVYFDYKGDFCKWEGGPLYLDRSIPEDMDIKKKLAPYAKLVHEAENVPVGETIRSMKIDDCVFGECAIGDMLVDAFTEMCNNLLGAGEHCLAFIQRGNLKSSIMAGTITQGSLFELLPYYDRLEVFQLQGKYIREALERSVSEPWELGPFKGPWLLQVSGLKVIYNISLPESHRITSVKIGNKSPYSPLDDDHLYTIITAAYLADGGDGFTMFKEHKQNVKMVGRDQNVLEAYIRKHSPLDIQTDGRLIINS